MYWSADRLRGWLQDSLAMITGFELGENEVHRIAIVLSNPDVWKDSLSHT